MEQYALEHEKEVERLDKQSEQVAYSLDDELSSLSIQENATILDAGCGSGIMSRYLAGKYPDATIYACDLSELRIKQAHKRSPSHNINFFQSPLESIELESNSCDIVICRYVYEYLKRPIEVARELKRVLRPGGKLCLIDNDGIFLNYYTSNRRFNELLQKVQSNIDLDLFVGRKLPSYLVQAGLENVQWQVSVHNFPTRELLEEEYDNNKDRLIHASDVLIKALGSQELYEEFSALYLSEMYQPGNTLYFNKFIAWGTKDAL